MTKKEFLGGLELALKRKNVSDIDEIIADYNEHFEAGASVGKSEHQIIIELGAIDAIASEYDSRPNAAINQNFGNITNFYNAAEPQTHAQREPQTHAQTRSEPQTHVRTRTEPHKNGFSQERVVPINKAKESDTTTSEVRKKEKSTSGGNVGGAILRVLLGIIYAVGGLIIAIVSISLTITAIATMLSLIVSGVVLSISTWFIFGSFLIKLSGLFLGLGVIMLGILLSKLMFLALALIKSVYYFIISIFKKALKGATA